MENIKTPQFVYFPEQARENIKKFFKFTKNDIEILYAVKANNHPELIELFIKNGYGFDVASKEEFQYIVSKGGDPRKISFSAPTKKEGDLKLAGKTEINYYAFDSEIEIKKIVKNVKKPILFARISTPSKESAFDLSTKFGMDDKYFIKILKKTKKKKWNIKGLTFHVGSQNISINSWRRSLNKIKYLIDIADEYGVKIDYLNLGGGIPASYNGNVQEVDYYISEIIALVKKLRKSYSFKKVFVEPGRALSANTMILLTKIINIKPYKKPPIAIVDTSVFSGLIEPLEHFEYPIYTVDDLTNSGSQRSGKKYFRIGGYSCDGYDIVKKKTLLPKETKLGDKLIILYAGAYTFVYENFHMKPFPKISNYTSV